MKTFRNAILVIVFVAAITGVTNIIMSFSVFKDVDFSALGDMLSGVAAAIAVFYAIVQYKSYLEDRKTKTLNEFNQRYVSDESIEKVIRWMVANAKYDENGRIVGKDPEKNEGEMPSIYDKEMFMRFFEELNILINKGLLNEKDTLKMFAYYALVFDEYPSFREDIRDYDNKKQWYDFHQFIFKTGQAKNLQEAVDKLKEEIKKKE